MCINIVSTQSAAGMLSTDVNTNKHQDTEDIQRIDRMRGGQDGEHNSKGKAEQHKVAT